MSDDLHHPYAVTSVYNFNQKAILEGKFNDAQIGQRVIFESDGTRATSVRLLNEVISVRQIMKTDNKSKDTKNNKNHRKRRKIKHPPHRELDRALQNNSLTSDAERVMPIEILEQCLKFLQGLRTHIVFNHRDLRLGHF